MAILDRELEAGGLGVQLEQQGERVILGVWGELDHSSANEFETKLRQAIRGSAFGVILDLDGVTFIDSTGLRCLLSAAVTAHGIGRELVVLRGSEQVRDAIETSGAEDLLPLAD